MRPVIATLRAAFAEAIANRHAFWTQIAAMTVNDIAWVAFWFLVFDQVGTIGGWQRHEILVLLSVLTVAGGLVLGLFSNTRRLGQLIHDGGLDAVLALPIRPLPVLLVRRVDPINFGDVIFGCCLYATTGPTIRDVGVFVLVTALGAVVLASFLVAAGSLTFFARSTDAGDFGFNVMLMLAAYPVDLFAGLTRVFVFTVVPAVFVATVPARILTDTQPGDLLLLAGAAFAFAATAVILFSIGLRRYTGTSVWTRA